MFVQLAAVRLFCALKTLTLVITCKPFIPAMFIGTIDFYNTIQFSLTLTLVRDRKVSRKQNLSANVLGLFSNDHDEV